MSTRKITLVRKEIEEPDFELSHDQLAAATHVGTPLIVLGGPGTGKTTVLINAALARISAGVNPDSILLLTFGRERASQLRDAIALRTTETMFEPLARTFHSLAYSILKMKIAPNDPDPILLSGPEQESFIRELLSGDIEDGYKQWPEDLHKALSTHGFARELRDLILRASERSITPDQLAELGEKMNENFWVAAAAFWKRYRGAMVMREMSAGDAKLRIDPSELLGRATRHLQLNPDLLMNLRSRFSTVMVDEFQETDPAQRALLRALAGADLVLAGDMDSAVGRFRGADPEGMMRELDYYQSQSGKQIILKTVFRSEPEIFKLGVAMVSQFRSTSPTRTRTCAFEAEPAQRVEIARLKSTAEEAQYIAYQFRRAHLKNGVPYSHMAIILRTPGVQSSAIRRAFSQVGIPVAGEIQALAGNAAIEPFLLIARIAIKSALLTIENAEKLLLSELGGADAISLRRIRRALLSHRLEGDLRPGNQLLIDAINTGDISIDECGPIIRVHDLLEKARKILCKKDSRAEDLLWAIWNNALNSDGASLSQTWQSTALRGGNRGASADRDLDAMMQLFESAHRFSERFPLSGPKAFIEEISREEIVGDVITSKGVRVDAVEILTVHSAKGREWELVAIAGVQEGVWPNLRQRSSLLGSERLVERERHGDLPRAQLDTISASALLEDERRLIHVATTRAQKKIFITAVSRDEDQPSQFFEEIYEHLHQENPGLILDSEIPRAITPSALVAALRRALDGSDSTVAASIIKKLSDAGISTADVHSWAGVNHVSTDLPVVAPSDLVIVSPSSSESFEECGVKWFLEKNGGKNGDSVAQVLGSAIHAFAALMVEQPQLTKADLIAKLESSWNLIDPNQGWVSKTSLKKAIAMIERFVRYHVESKRTVVGVELKFDVSVGRARIMGSVDRLEVASDGSLYVIDFKTSKTPISKEDAKENLQLRSYQLAVAEGGFLAHSESVTPSGAALIYLGHDKKSISKRDQEEFDLDLMREKVSQIADGMGSHHFKAATNKRCKECPVRSSCPIQAEGRSVIQ